MPAELGIWDVGAWQQRTMVKVFDGLSLETNAHVLLLQQINCQLKRKRNQNPRMTPDVNFTLHVHKFSKTSADKNEILTSTSF